MTTILPQKSLFKLCQCFYLDCLASFSKTFSSIFQPKFSKPLSRSDDMEKKLLGIRIKNSTQMNSFKRFANMASDNLFLVTTVPLTSYEMSHPTRLQSSAYNLLLQMTQIKQNTSTNLVLLSKPHQIQIYCTTELILR